ncbi:hypothetical protein A2U01_0086525, partial [Trifolium medium]|nr:hypothetical protein [Trifolium medium]
MHLTDEASMYDSGRGNTTTRALAQ